MSDYKPLQKLYYQTNGPKRDSLIDELATNRLEDDASFRTGIIINSNELFLAMPRQLTLVYDKTLRIERKVSQLWHELPELARRAYLRGLIMDEIVSSNEIEGVHSTRRQIEDALEHVDSTKPKKAIKRFREFARLYLEISNKDRLCPKTPSDIRNIYDIIMLGELDKKDEPDGELFRKNSVDVVNASGIAIHSGVYPESAIIKLLEKMLALSNSSEMPATLAAIVAHFLFEYTHPFYDGNGRTGRYLLALQLSEPLSLATVLSLSKNVAENKSRYYKAFQATEHPLNRGELTFFVIQMMEFINNAQASIVEDLEMKKLLISGVEEQLVGFTEVPHQLSVKEIDVLYLAVQCHLFGVFSETSLQDIAKHMDVSAQTARRYTQALESIGLIQTVSQKPLKFVLTGKAQKLLGL